jgi:DNA-binding transcriptional LysR family regulator
MAVWEFEKDGETIIVDPKGQLLVQPGLTADLLIAAAVAGLGIIRLFEDWLRPELESRALVPILRDWEEVFPGPFLYYPGRRYLPAPLRAFVDFVKTTSVPA